jgi:hypothetical protein
MTTGGRLDFVRLTVPQAGWCANIITNMVTAASGLTAGQNFSALFAVAGNANSLVAQSVDQSTAWVSTGQKTMQLAGGPYFLHAGDYYGALWYNGTTGPSFLRGGNVAAAANYGLSAPNLAYGNANTGLTVAAPSSIASQVSSTGLWWMALDRVAA